MKDLLVICDSETAYARRLSEYLINKDDFCYEISIYSSSATFIDAMNSQMAKLFVIDEVFLDELNSADYIQNIKESKTIILTRDRERIDSNSLNEGNDVGIYLYKYQAAHILYEKVMGLLREGASNSIQSIATNIASDDQSKRIKQIVKNAVQEKLLLTGNATDNETIKIIDECIDRDYKSLNDIEKKNIRNEVFYSIRGLDVLEEFISDESITEIMVNGENSIFYEREGRLIHSNKCFDSREQLIDIIQKIVASANRTVNLSSPIVDARLADGSRINAVLSPVSIDGPTLTIRKFPNDPLTAQKLISMGAVSEEIMNFINKLVYSGYNILISGCTGSGKTTFLNIMTGSIPKDERIITIEDSAELRIQGIKNLVRLETRNANVDGCSEITIRDLIRTALRMRPDRVIVGESRGAEAIDMIQAFSVGQDGSMSTIHANSAEDAVYRLEMLMMMGGLEMPLSAIRRQIAMGVDIVIHLGRLKDKSRKLLEIREVLGINDGNITTSVLYKYEGGNFVKVNELKNKYKLEKAGCF